MPLSLSNMLHNLSDRRLGGVRFAVQFSLILILMTLLYTQVALRTERMTDQQMSVTASLVTSIVRLCGMEASSHGRIVHCQDFSLEVIGECTGIHEILLLWAAMLAFRAPIVAKVIGLVLGAILTLAMNVLRVATLAMIGAHWPDAFDWAHRFTFQASMIIWIVILWVLWIRIVSGVRSAEIDAPVPV